MGSVGLVDVGEAGENEGRGWFPVWPCRVSFSKASCFFALQYILSVDRANLNKELLTGRLSLLFANSYYTLFAGDLGLAP